MRFNKAAFLATLIAFSSMLSAQTRPEQPFGLAPGQTPVMEIGVGYTFRHANAPPGQCGCFNLNGGVGSVVVNAPHGISIVADLSGTHANNISGTAQSITVFNYLFGARYSWRTLPKRFTPYLQALGGGAHEGSNYAYSQSLNGPAFSAGGGVSKGLTPHLGWNIVEADWIHSQLPNAQNTRQNDLRIGTAITFRFGPR